MFGSREDGWVHLERGRPRVPDVVLRHHRPFPLRAVLKMTFPFICQVDAKKSKMDGNHPHAASSGLAAH